MIEIKVQEGPFTGVDDLHAADAAFHDIAESFRASPWMRFRTVTLPARRDEPVEGCVRCS